MPNQHPRKASSMSRWVRGIYNAAANFVMSGSLRAASGSSMDRNAKHLREVAIESNERGKPCQSDKSNHEHACACHSARTCNCAAGDCADNDAACASDGKLPNNHGDSCTCPGCRSYYDYISAGASAISTEGQGAGARVRVSYESRAHQQPIEVSAARVEYITGIQSGVNV